MAALSEKPFVLSTNIQILNEKELVSAFATTEKTAQATSREPRPSQSPPPNVKLWSRCTDLAILAITRLRVDIGGTLEHPTPRKSRPLSEKGLFAFRYVDPLFSWWGQNSRVLASPSLGAVDVQNGSGWTSTLINGASHNYGAWYRQTVESARLHRLCLDELPVMSSIDSDDITSPIRLAMHHAIADFFEADFCYSTSTGYGSNYFALPALLQGSRVGVIADSYSHNSIFTGCFLASNARLLKFKHNNLKHLESLLREESWAFDRIIVIVEGLYSMEGDIPPFADLARLKQRYGFVLYCDEAHSFLTLGKTGRGGLELWNARHPAANLPSSLIDIRTATLSKSVGGIGGIIVGKAEFEKSVKYALLRPDAQESAALPTSTAVQTLWVLSQPIQTRYNLCYLAEVAKFIRRELQSAGVYVYGEPDTPIIPIWAGGPSTAAWLSYKMRKAGLLATPVSTPAVPFWESRVRINLSADYTAGQVNQLVDTVIKSAAICGIQNVSRHRHGSSGPPKFLAERRRDNSGEALSATARIHKVIRQSNGLPDERHGDRLSSKACEAARQSQLKFGIGSGSARWISGTYPSHLEVENLVTKATGTETTMTYPDGAIGLASTVAALVRPVLGTQKHYFLIPSKINPFVHDGLLLAMSIKSQKSNTVCRYDTVNEVPDTLHTVERKAGKMAKCYTIYLCVHGEDLSKRWCPSHCPGVSATSLPKVLQSVCEAVRDNSLTIVIRLSTILVDLSSLAFDFLESQKNVQVLLYGSFMEFYGLQGGFLAGSRRLIQELRYSSRGYMYTTSTPPYIMDMIKVRLQSEKIDQ